MVLVAFKHVYSPVHVSLLPFRLFGQRFLTVIHAVRLDICLIIHVKAQLVTKLVETARLRVVRQPYGVDIVLLHQCEILQHQLLGDIVSRLGIGFVDIYTFQLDGLTIYQKETVDPVASSYRFDLITAKSNRVGDNLSPFFPSFWTVIRSL